MAVIKSTILGEILTMLIFFLADHVSWPIYWSNWLMRACIALIILILVAIMARVESGTVTRDGINVSIFVSIVAVGLILLVNLLIPRDIFFRTSGGAITTLITMGVASLIISIFGVIRFE